MDYQIADYGGGDESGEGEDVGDVVDVLVAGFGFCGWICEGWGGGGGFGLLVAGVSDVWNL